MKRLFTTSMLTLALGLLAQPASAQVYWSSIATACVPDSVSIQNDRYSSQVDSYVTPKPQQLEPIALICAVTPNTGAPNPNTLSMTYLDSTGANTNAQVTAQLIGVKRSNGARSLMVTLTSDGGVTTTTQRSVPFTATLNFNAFYYYVRIQMDRVKTNQNIRSIGVALEKASGA